MRQQLRKLFGDAAKTAIGLARNQTREIGAHRAHGRRNRHVVVVEHHDHARIHRARIVHCLIGHAGAHRAVADHRDDIVLLALEIACHGKTESRRNRGGRMGRTERIERTFGPLGESRKSRALAQGAHAIATAGQNLVRIGLVADIPDEFVGRRVEHIVERDGQFDDAEPRTQMAAGDRNDIDGFLAQFIGQLAQIGAGKAPQRGRFPHLVQKRRWQSHTQTPTQPLLRPAASAPSRHIKFPCRRQKVDSFVRQIKATWAQVIAFDETPKASPIRTDFEAFSRPVSICQPISAGSTPSGPLAPSTIFSSRPSAAFNFFSQCAFSAWPRS